MTVEEARRYLVTASQTEIGKQALRALGLSVVIDDPEGGDDSGTVLVAAKLDDELRRRYPDLFR